MWQGVTRCEKHFLLADRFIETTWGRNKHFLLADRFIESTWHKRMKYHVLVATFTCITTNDFKWYQMITHDHKCIICTRHSVWAACRWTSNHLSFQVVNQLQCVEYVEICRAIHAKYVKRFLPSLASDACNNPAYPNLPQRGSPWEPMIRSVLLSGLAFW